MFRLVAIASLLCSCRLSLENYDTSIQGTDAGNGRACVVSTTSQPCMDATTHSDLAFIELAFALHGAGATLSLGTHDPVIREALLPALAGAGVEMLLGVRSEDLPSLVARAVPVRVYVPYGDRWFRYAMRRAAESRGAT